MRRVGEESRRSREPAACLAIPRTAARKTHLTRPRSVPLPPPRSHSPRAVFQSPSNEECPQRALGRADARTWALPKAMGGMPDVVTSGIRSSIEAVTADACAPGSTDTRGVGFAAAAPENFPRAKPALYFNGTLRYRPHSPHENVIASAGGHPLAHQS